MTNDKSIPRSPVTRDTHGEMNFRSGFKKNIVALVVSCLCLGYFSAPSAETADQGDPDLANADTVALGKKRFNRACFYCHGYEGVGGKGASLQRRPDLTPELIFSTIAKGRIRGSSVMPPWRNSLTDEEIWQLVAYILSLREMPEQEK